LAQYNLILGYNAYMGEDSLMVFINDTTSTGIVINFFTYNITGDLFGTLLIFLALFLAVAFLFRIPLEWTMPLILPLLIGYMAYSSQFLAVGGVILIYLAVVFTKMFVINE